MQRLPLGSLKIDLLPTGKKGVLCRQGWTLVFFENKIKSLAGKVVDKGEARMRAFLIINRKIG
jgi:hypothetical protein